MALIDETTASVRLDVPGEPGQWIELRRLAWGEVRRRVVAGDEGSSAALMLASVSGWSYPQPVTEATIDQIDLATARWLSEQITRVNGLDAAVGEGSAASSNGTTSTAAAGLTS